MPTPDPMKKLPRLMMISSIPECRARFFEAPAEPDGGDAPREAGFVIGFDRKAAQRCGPERGLELGARNAPDEPRQRLVLRHAYARVVVARHAHVGYEGGAARKHLVISGRHMGMGADHEAHLAVEKVPHRLLFAGGFRVDVDDDG